MEKITPEMVEKMAISDAELHYLLSGGNFHIWRQRMKSGVELIAIERQEQIEKHDRTIESDVLENLDYQLADAARLIMWPRIVYEKPRGWNQRIWQKMVEKAYKERLIIAGALIAAEIDRLQFLEMEQSTFGGKE